MEATTAGEARPGFRGAAGSLRWEPSQSGCTARQEEPEPRHHIRRGAVPHQTAETGEVTGQRGEGRHSGGNWRPQASLIDKCVVYVASIMRKLVMRIEGKPH